MRVGGVVASDRPRDRPPQLIVSRAGKERLQELGDVQVRFQSPQRLVKLARMRKRCLVRQERACAGTAPRFRGRR